MPQRRKWHPTPIFLPEEFHGQRSLVGYSSWGHKELDTTEQLILYFYNYTVMRGFPGGSNGKESTYNVGELGLILGLGRSPGEGKGYLL